jgi:hypothetical protein
VLEEHRAVALDRADVVTPLALIERHRDHALTGERQSP